jgi:hypothetical protein
LPKTPLSMFEARAAVPVAPERGPARHEPRRTAVRRGGLAAAALAVVGVHMMVLALFDGGARVRAHHAGQVAVVSVRTVQTPALFAPAPQHATMPAIATERSAPSPAAPPTHLDRSAAPAAGRMPAQLRRGEAGLRNAGHGAVGDTVVRAEVAVSAPLLDRPSVVMAPATGLSEAQRPRSGATEADPHATAPPPDVVRYSTVIPPSANLRFRMRRGAVQGHAELNWLVREDHYELRLESRVAGALLLAQTSQGGFDAFGLAPLRFTDQRARRGTLAVNFQRDAGRITFSAVSNELQLGTSAQDRLSWLVQLAAIAGAEPQRLAAGGEIILQVVGARADAVWWRFVSLGEEQLDTPSGPRSVVHLQRPADTDYDTRVEVWLEAQAPHWPVRAEWRSGPNDPGVELWRSDAAELR